jgi:hypothetical protein
MKLTNVKATSFNPALEQVIYHEAGVGIGTAVTDIRSKYDLNRDNKVDALDLSVALLYFGYTLGDPNWGALVKVKDSRGGDITPVMCDVNGDDKVDMLDLMEIYINYFPPR